MDLTFEQFAGLPSRFCTANFETLGFEQGAHHSPDDEVIVNDQNTPYDLNCVERLHNRVMRVLVPG